MPDQHPPSAPEVLAEYVTDEQLAAYEKLRAHGMDLITLTDDNTIAGCLEIAADGKPWRIQLETMGAEFCAQVNRNWGGNLVREIKFLDDQKLRRISHEFNNDHTPFVRRRKP